MVADAVLTIGGFVLALGLLPSFRRGNRPSIRTSLLSASTISAFAVVYWCDGRILAALSAALSVSMWTALAALKVMER